MEVDAVGGEVCIAIPPFYGLRHGLRVPELSGSHAWIVRHKISTEDAWKTVKIRAELPRGLASRSETRGRLSRTSMFRG
jgi:hypothetical protein